MRTKRIYISSAIILLLLLFASCSKKLNYEKDDETAVEVVNGLAICWANGLSQEKKEIIRGIVNDMVLVEGGSYSMGVDQIYDSDSRKNESPSHYVRLSDYYICSHELSVAQLAGLADNSTSIFPKQNTFFYSYSDWESFINRLKEHTGLQFDFPTEAQWEYAARGGNRSRHFLYPGSDNWEDVWSDGNEESVPSIANELGLFNLADNYSEWCKDVYSEYESKGMQENPCNMFTQESGRLYYVVRGGCYQSYSTVAQWSKESSSSSSFSFSYSHKDYRLCRSTARTYGNGKSSDIILRPVINILEYEK